LGIKAGQATVYPQPFLAELTQTRRQSRNGNNHHPSLGNGGDESLPVLEIGKVRWSFNSLSKYVRARGSKKIPATDFPISLCAEWCQAPRQGKRFRPVSPKKRPNPQSHDLRDRATFLLSKKGRVNTAKKD
jgi:hypothetical protein